MFTASDVSYYVDFLLVLFIASWVKLFRSWQSCTGGESPVIGRTAEARAQYMKSNLTLIFFLTGMCKLSHPIIIRSHPYQNLFDRLE